MTCVPTARLLVGNVATPRDGRHGAQRDGAVGESDEAFRADSARSGGDRSRQNLGGTESDRTGRQESEE